MLFLSGFAVWAGQWRFYWSDFQSDLLKVFGLLSIEKRGFAIFFLSLGHWPKTDKVCLQVLFVITRATKFLVSVKAILQDYACCTKSAGA